MANSFGPLKDETVVDPPVVIVRDNLVPPKVGSQVLFVAAKGPRLKDCIRAAVVVGVDEFDSHRVELVYFTTTKDSKTCLFRAGDVVHHEPDEEGRVLFGTWHWPPPRTLVFKAQSPSEPPMRSEIPTGAEYSSLSDPIPEGVFKKPEEP